MQKLTARLGKYDITLLPVLRKRYGDFSLYWALISLKRPSEKHLFLDKPNGKVHHTETEHQNYCICIKLKHIIGQYSIGRAYK